MSGYDKAPAVCIQCGKSFMAFKTSIRRGGGKYCKRACQAAHDKATGRLRGAGNPRWKGGVSNVPLEYRERQKERWPERVRARRKVQYAIESGRLTKQPCQSCGAARAEAHHEDYSKPLKVTWLCRGCHVDHHAHDQGVTP